MSFFSTVLSLFLLLFWSLVFSFSDIDDPSITWDIFKCPRNRRAWHLLSSTEREEYADVIKQLNDNGKREIFSKANHELTDAMQSHFTSAFFPWHRYFLFSIESEIRKLDIKYKCFALPYWDVTHEASRESNPFILKSGIGGSAQNLEDNNYCVTGHAWTADEYPLNHICFENEAVGHCCLKRRLNSDLDIISAARLGYEIRYGKPIFGTSSMQNSWSWFTTNILFNNAHNFIGSDNNGFLTHFISFYASDDPIFYLMHTWLDYLWIVWMNCHGYSEINEREIDVYPNAFNIYSELDESIPVELDDELLYIPMEDIPWWTSTNTEYIPTSRKMFDISKWNIFYSMGTFVTRSHLTEICDHRMANAWLRDENNSGEDLDVFNMDVHSGNDVTSDDNQTPAVLTIIDVYNDISYAQMRKYQNEKQTESISDADLLQSWAGKSCEYQKKMHNKKVCRLVDIQIEYEKCSDHASNSYMTVHTSSTTKRYDIRVEIYQISLEEMLNMKGVKGNECLEDVRKNQYSWLKTMNKLYELCNGEYDKTVVCEDIVVEYDPLDSVAKYMKEDVDIKDIQSKLDAEIDMHAIFYKSKGLDGEQNNDDSGHNVGDNNMKSESESSENNRPTEKQTEIPVLLNPNPHSSDSGNTGKKKKKSVPKISTTSFPTLIPTSNPTVNEEMNGSGDDGNIDTGNDENSDESNHKRDNSGLLLKLKFGAIAFGFFIAFMLILIGTYAGVRYCCRRYHYLSMINSDSDDNEEEEPLMSQQQNVSMIVDTSSACDDTNDASNDSLYGTI